MNRSDFQKLAEIRIEEATVLLDAGKWDGAYYLAGYGVECALKACIARLTKADDFPPREVKGYYTHDLNVLLQTAQLARERDSEAGINPTFTAYWTLVVKWNEQSRYDRKSQAEAKALYDAIADPTDGVLLWVRRHW